MERRERERGGVERRRGGDPLGSQVLFSCCAHVLCMTLLCIFQGPSGHGVLHTHTHSQGGTLSLQSTALYGVGKRACVCERIIRHLPNVVGGSRE